MKLEQLREKLEQIRDFGHVEGCTCGAPVYEWEKDQSELAEEALQILEELETPSIGELLGM